MGNPSSFYTVSCKCSNGTVVYGSGDTEDKARFDAIEKAKRHEIFVSGTPIEQLKQLASGELLDSDQRKSIKLIAQILEKMNNAS